MKIRVGFSDYYSFINLADSILMQAIAQSIVELNRNDPYNPRKTM